MEREPDEMRADDFATHLVVGDDLAYRDLREFVKALEKAESEADQGEVDPGAGDFGSVQRVARDLKRAEKSVGPALCLKNRKGRGIRFL